MAGYTHHFQELCDRINYDTVVFFQDSGEVLAFKMRGNNKIPTVCTLNFQYDLIGNENSKVFYGMNLSIDNQTIVCSGSVNMINVGTRTVVIVFFDTSIKMFRDNQLPKIMWKSKEGIYLGYSEYVPYDSNITHTMLGKKDKDIYTGSILESIRETDEKIYNKGEFCWDTFGRVKSGTYTTMIKYQKFPYYSVDNEVMGLILVYAPIIESTSFFSSQESELSKEQIENMIKETLSSSNMVLLIYNHRNGKLVYATENFDTLGYDTQDFKTGRKQLVSLMHPGDVKMYTSKLEELLYQKKQSFSFKSRLIGKDGKVYYTKLKLVPIIPNLNKIEFVAMIVEFSNDFSEENKRADQIIQLANKGQTIYAFRNSDNPMLIDFVTNNVTQFGYTQEEIINGKSNFADIVHHDDLPFVIDQFQKLKSGILKQMRLEYRIFSHRKDIYWIEEKCYVVKNDKGISFESILRNVTTSRHAIEELNRMTPMLEDSKEKQRFLEDLDVLLNHILSSIDLEKLIQDFSRLHSLHVAFFDNSDEFIKPYATSLLTLEILKNQFFPKGWTNIKELGSAQFDNVICKSIPLGFEGYRIGTMVAFGVLDEIESDNLYVDESLQFDKIPYSMIAEHYEFALEFAENISQMIHLTSVTLNQSLYSNRFHTDLIHMRKKHAILLEMLDLANTYENIEDLFDVIFHKIGETFQLSRGAIFIRDHQDSSMYHCIKEWTSEFDESHIEDLKNINKDDTFLKNWNYNEQNSFVIHYDDEATHKNISRDISRALVSVGIANKAELIGVMNFVDNHSQRIWSDDDVMLFEDFGYIFSYVAQKKSSNEKIKVNQNQLIQILNSLPNAVAIFDKSDESVIQSNDSFKVLFLSANGYDDSEDMDSLKDIVRENQSKSEPSEIYLSSKDQWFLIEKNEVDFGYEKKTCMMILTDITSNKKSTDIMSELAFKDIMCDIPNRVKFILDIKKTYESKQGSISNAFIGILNLDNFKMINNTYSYTFGDALIKEIARQLSKISEIQNNVYRFGGDEFAILVNGNYGEQIYEVANKIMSLFESPFYVEGFESYVTVSLGISFFSDTDKDADALVRNANISLMEAKASGKNKFILYDVSLKKYEEDTMHMESALKASVDDGCKEFEVYYQPIIDAKTSKIVGAEALVRWFSKEIGYVPPVKFIPIAESTELIIPLGKYILNQACKEAKKWLDHGYNIQISVNFSVIQMLQSDLISTILSAIHTYRIPPKNLIVEITESLAIKDVTKIVDILNSVRQIGVKIAMDDFGTGYSSLSHLRKLPLDSVKIDRSFAFNLEYDPYYFSFIETITTFCHLNNTKVTVEGIENENQKNILAKTSVDTLQGYLFARPESASDFWRLLAKQSTTT